MMGFTKLASAVSPYLKPHIWEALVYQLIICVTF